jgi:hypothetical protein
MRQSKESRAIRFTTARTVRKGVPSDKYPDPGWKSGWFQALDFGAARTYS